MAVIKDPEGVQSAILLSAVDFKDLQVLEVGCGDGRITWCFADQAAHVTGVDPDGDAIEKAIKSIPDRLKDRVKFLESSIADFFEFSNDRKFDLALYSWSL